MAYTLNPTPSLTSSGSSRRLPRCFSQDPSCDDGEEKEIVGCSERDRSAAALRSLCLWLPRRLLPLRLPLLHHHHPVSQRGQPQSGCPPLCSSCSSGPGCSQDWSWRDPHWWCRPWRSRRRKPRWCCHRHLSLLHRSAKTTWQLLAIITSCLRCILFHTYRETS